MKLYKMLKIGTVLALALVTVAYASYTAWYRTFTWTDIGNTSFGVYLDAETGTELPSGGTHETPAIGVNTIDFFIQNDGDVDITVTVVGTTTVGCTASWSPVESWDILKTATDRLRVTLTLDVKLSTGTYIFEFTSTAATT